MYSYSVTNMILHGGGHSRKVKGFVRLASKNSISRGAHGTRFHRRISTAMASVSTSDEFPSQSLSTCKISPRGLNVDRTTLGLCHSVLSSNIQRRFRSALPDDYDYDDEVDDDDDYASSSATPFLLADIGEGIAEVELMHWFVEEGQVISEFDRVCEVQSDKATVEITSRFGGTIQKLAYQSEGSMIKVGEPILWILEKEDGLSPHDTAEKPQQPKQERLDNTLDEEQSLAIATATTTASLSSQKEATSTARDIEASTIVQEAILTPESKEEPSNLDVSVTQEQDTGDIFVPIATKKVLTSPAVRKLARDNCLDLCTIEGTGPVGRILKGDVLAIIQELDSTTELEDSPTTAEECNRTVGENTVVPLQGYNRIMADTMAASLQIPHMVYSDEINLNQFVRYKMEQQRLDHHNPPLPENSKKLLFLPLAIKAASKALGEYPWLNASFDAAKHEATLWKDHNIGIAMDTPRGLIVPVIKKCQNKSLPELAEELKRLKASVMEGGGGLQAEDLRGATFTLSNVGAIGGGGTYMSPIITPPQVAIGALGQIRRLPRFVTPSSTDPAESQTIEEAHICAVSWAADHRVVDGATVARFHKSFKEYMEDPIRLLLELR